MDWPFQSLDLNITETMWDHHDTQQNQRTKNSFEWPGKLFLKTTRKLPQRSSELCFCLILPIPANKGRDTEHEFCDCGQTDGWSLSHGISSLVVNYILIYVLLTVVTYTLMCIYILQQIDALP